MSILTESSSNEGFATKRCFEVPSSCRQRKEQIIAVVFNFGVFFAFFARSKMLQFVGS